MKVVHLSTVDTGGAANAAYRLHQGLLDSGIDSKFLVLHNTNALKEVLTFHTPSHDAFRFFFRKVKYRFWRWMTGRYLNELSKDVEIFSTPISIYDVNVLTEIRDSEIIHLHWIANFIDYPSFFKKNRKPLVWTFHDENPLHGGIHYSGDILKLSTRLLKIEKYFEKIKKNALTGTDKIWPICPSPWLLKAVKSSLCQELFKEATCIYYGIDTEKFKLQDKSLARKQLGLPEDKRLILLICSNLNLYRKGFDLFRGLIERIKSDDQLEFVLAGELTNVMPLQFCRHIGIISDQSKLVQLYNAVDATIVPSREDNLPNVMIESLTCGTPVLGFRVGGIQDVIHDNFNGLLARQVSVDELYNTVIKFLSLNFSSYDIRKKAIEIFSNDVQVDKVTELYKNCIKTNMPN